MKVHELGIIMNGVTGRMGTNQHLLRSIVAIRNQGGVKLNANECIMPYAILVGRNENKLKHLCEISGMDAWTTDLDSVLREDAYQIYFDAQITGRRFDAVKKAIEAGKHIYCEKPSGASLEEGLELYRLAEAKGVKHGVVQDKLWLPGLLKIQRLIQNGFFGRNSEDFHTLVCQQDV